MDLWTELRTALSFHLSMHASTILHISAYSTPTVKCGWNVQDWNSLPVMRRLKCYQKPLNHYYILTEAIRYADCWFWDYFRNVCIESCDTPQEALFQYVVLNNIHKSEFCQLLEIRRHKYTWASQMVISIIKKKTFTVMTGAMIYTWEYMGHYNPKHRSCLLRNFFFVTISEDLNFWKCCQ